MNRTVRTVILALFLCAISLTIFLHKVISSDIPLFPDQTYQSWYVETKVFIDSERSLLSSEEELPDLIEVQLPQFSSRYRLIDEDFINDGYEREIETRKPFNNRVAVFNNTGIIGSKTLFYRTIIDEKGFSDDSNPTDEPVSITGRRLVNQQFNEFSEDRAEILEELMENAPDGAIDSLLREAKSRSSDRLTLAQAVYELALRTDDIRIQTLIETLNVDDSAPKIAVFLLKRAQVPARVGNGIKLTKEEVYSTDFIQWLEVQQENSDRWLAFDSVNLSFTEETPYLTWWYGSQDPMTVTGSGDVRLEVLVRPNTDEGLTQAIWQERASFDPFLNYSLLKLPLTTQRVFQVLVLVPIGALIIALLHQVIGIPTFGTFTPILIALSFRETGLMVGIPLFILVVALGLLIRAGLNYLQLLIVPRLASILTATVLIMGALAVIMEHFNINLGLSISLFPIVILAMTIERAAVMWEEEGAKNVIISGLGSVFVATIGYFCTINDYVQHIAFAFPELLLMVLAVNILLGRYNGYKLTEYLRFRALQQQMSQ